jgi:hypothetical protein
MELHLITLHGRYDPDETMQDWGFHGPRIEGVTALHVTYNSTWTLWFKDKASCDRAQAITGWPPWDENALELQFHDDLLKCIPVGCDGPIAYYGDWEIELAAP